jgi:hypothetical protein
VSHVWTVWVVFDRSGVFSKEPPRSLCCHDWVQLIRKYAAPAENRSVLVKLDYPLFRLIFDPKHLRQCTPLSERRHPERGNQVACLRFRFLLESLRYKWTSHLSPEPRLVRVCTQTVPVVTNWRPPWGSLSTRCRRPPFKPMPIIGVTTRARFRMMQSTSVEDEVVVQQPLPITERAASPAPEQQLAVTADNILAGPPPCGEAMHTDTASVTSVILTVVLRGEEYLPTFSGDPDEDPEMFIAEIREFFAAPQNASLPERVKARLAHRQLRGRAAKSNLFFLTRDRTISDLEGRLLEEFGAEANFAELYEEFKRGTLGWEEPVEVFFARKTALYRRLFPDAPEARLVKELINQMPRPTLAGQCPQRVVDLKRAAKEVLPYIRPTTKPENWRRTDGKSPSRSEPTN